MKEQYSRPDMNELNRQIIEEFRAHAGKVGGRSEGVTLLLLTTTGARSGQRHTSPLGYMPDGDRLIIFATHGGLPTNPNLLYNLVAHPEAIREDGIEAFDVTAESMKAQARGQVYAKYA